MVEDRFHVEIEMQQAMSEEAKKIFPEYYELLVQIRFKWFDQEGIACEENTCDEHKEKKEEKSFGRIQVGKRKERTVESIKKDVYENIVSSFKGINKMEELEDGFDFYFANCKTMSSLSSFFSKKYFCEIKRSAKLTGVDQLRSKKTYRYFLSIVLVNLHAGDFVLYKGEKYFVKAVMKGMELVLVDEKGKKGVYRYSIIKDYLNKV